MVHGEEEIRTNSGLNSAQSNGNQGNSGLGIEIATNAWEIFPLANSTNELPSVRYRGYCS